MSIDLLMLVASAVLCALLFVPYGLAQIFVWGVPTAVGNRSDTPPLPAWAERGVRAHRNLLEAFPHFAALVVVSHLTGTSNEVTAMGATIFFWARVTHAVVYVGGVPIVRTLAFFAGLAGEGLILSQLFGGIP